MNARRHPTHRLITWLYGLVLELWSYVLAQTYTPRHPAA